jgi:hypothetical protein
MTDQTIDRRSILRTVGAGVGAATIGTGAATARGPPGFPPRRHTTWGESGSLGDGECRAFVTANPAGKPMFVGARFGADELSGLPGGTEHHHVNLSLPNRESDENPTHYRFLEYDWNPAGHPPPGVYTVPHFDFHFYTMPQEEVHAIEFSDDPTPLPARQRPPGYFHDRVVVPEMGLHWFDGTAPEWNNGEFAHTFIYGSYEGDLTFGEPMVTKAFLEAEYEEVRTAIATPDAFPDAGWYPTEYVIRYLGNRDAYAVTLESFEWFPAASDPN